MAAKCIHEIKGASYVALFSNQVWVKGRYNMAIKGGTRHRTKVEISIFPG